jgi:hypothetical protein
MFSDMPGGDAVNEEDDFLGGRSRPMKKTRRIRAFQPSLTSRDVIEMKRKIERMYSSMLSILIAYRSCLYENIADDYVYFAKLVVDATPGD